MVIMTMMPARMPATLVDGIIRWPMPLEAVVVEVLMLAEVVKVPEWEGWNEEEDDPRSSILASCMIRLWVRVLEEEAEDPTLGR